MDETLQTMLRDALLNNTYDHASTHLALKKAWENSFSYLYQMQIDKIGYDEYHYYSNDRAAKDPITIGHLYLDDYIRACFDIDKDIIHVCDRKEFRLSKYYHSYFTLDDMISDGSIFQWIPIVIIDDHVIWDWDMKVISKDAVQFRLPKAFRRQFVLKNERDPITDEIIYIDHKIQVLIVQNVYYERLKLNKFHLYLNPVGKSISIHKQMMTKENLPSTSKEGIYFISISFPDDGSYATYLGTQLLGGYESDDSITCYLDDALYEKLTRTSGTMWINVVFVNELHRKIWYSGINFTQIDMQEGDLMVLNRGDDFEPYASPIPIENFLIFRKKKDETVFQIIPNIESVKLYYPNIYQITDKNRQNGDIYEVYYFYHYNTFLQYTCIHDFWFRFLKLHFSTPDNEMSMEEILNRIWKKSMRYPGWTAEQIYDFKNTFHTILNYLYKHYKYAETDFLYNWMNVGDTPQEVRQLNGKPFQYKEGRLKEWIRDDPWLLRDYVLEQKKVGASYHLFTNTLDLTSRLRTNTMTELHYDYEFEQPMYVFAMRNDREYPIQMDIRFFVDGIFVEHMFQDRYLFMDYLFIPADLVTEDSYLEMEVFPRYEMKQPLRFETLDDVQTIHIVEPSEADIWPTIADAYLMQRKNQDDEYTHLYENSLREFFKITSCYKEGEWDIQTTDSEKPVRFTRLKDFKIQPVDESILHKDIDFWITKQPIGLHYQITHAGYPYLQLVGAEKKFRYHADYIRVFRNGRLLPNCKWAFFSTFECPRIQLMEWFDVGDTIYFDITPYRYKMIYYKEELEPGETLIDLSGIITKPFDWRYYDVYMNGRKLSMNNLFSIMPWKMTMVNLKSSYNLAIYEKERDWEYYGLNYKESIYFFTPDDLFNKSWVTEEEKNTMIKNIIDVQKDERLNIYPNTNDEPKQDWEDNRQYVLLMTFYYNELMPKTFVNPSVLQFNKTIMSEDYSTVYDTYTIQQDRDCRTAYEQSIRKSFPEILMLDPDVIVSGENAEGLTYVYPVGHLDEVEEDLLNESVCINDETNKIG